MQNDHIEKVLVTGANGFLAGHIIRILLSQGYRVRGMMRSGAKAPALAGLAVEIFFGNITSLTGMEQAINGCDLVIHTAADTSQSHLDHDDYYPANVLATRNIVEICRANRIKRLVFVSTANTFGYGTCENPGTENQPASDLFLKSGYAHSKYLAQNIVLQAVHDNKMDAVIVNPTFMIGPLDFNPHSGRIFKMVLNKRLVFYPPGGKNFIDVRDAATGVVNALIQGKKGETYLLAGHNLPYHEFYRRILKVSQQKSWLVQVPEWSLKIIGFTGDVFRFFRIPAEFHSVNTKILCISNFYSNLKAITGLGLHCRPLETTLRDYLNWKLENRH